MTPQAELILKVMFNDGNDMRSIWRLSQGSYTKAWQITKGVLSKYKGGSTVSIDDFDEACAEANDGCEMEWEAP
jgi:hypothetical protein